MKTSESIKEITKALIAYQSELKDPAKTAINPAFKSKYVPLSEIIDATRDLANKHGLVIMQDMSGDGKTIGVATRIIHTSGEWIESEPFILPAKEATPQALASSSTYARRYSVSSFLFLGGDPDDDGNEAEKSSKKKPVPTGPVSKWDDSAIMAYEFPSPSLKGLTVRKCFEVEKEEPNHGIEWLNLVFTAPDASEQDRDVANRAKFLIRVPEAK